MIKFGTSRSCRASREVNIVQNVKPLCWIVDGINIEHNVGNFIHVYMW